MAGEKNKKLSVYLSMLLRHAPEEAGLSMDIHGWVSVEELIQGINQKGKYLIDLEKLERIVESDSKSRYRFSEDKLKIKACQGHSIPWVIPQIEYGEPPEFLYHGTTVEALEKIKDSGAISKMSRHAVHMQADISKAWESALRWRKKPVVLKIASGQYAQDGGVFGKTENEVWCTEQVPVKYLAEEIYVRE